MKPRPLQDFAGVNLAAELLIMGEAEIFGVLNNAAETMQAA